MAKLEIPSIIVNNTGSGASMDKAHSLKNRLSKQDEFEEIEDDLSPVEILPESNEKKDKKSTKDGNQKSEKNKGDSSLSRQRSHPKVKLLQRSHALRDDTSPPPDLESSAVVTLSVSSNVVTQNKNSNNKHKLGKQGSSQGSLEGSSPCLSRESSTEQYTDSTGIDLHQFIVDTLHRNQKDRILLLKIEQELGSFVKDTKRQSHKFPQMSSYQRMLVHRVAAYFGMEHNVDLAGTSVVINKTKATRLPDKKFRDLIRDELVPEEPKKSILKRDSSSFEEGKDSSSSQEGPVDSPVRSHESTHNSSRRSSQEDLRWITDPRPWSSTDSDSSNRPLKPTITKTSASTESDISSASRTTRGVLTKAESAENRETLHPRSRPSYIPKASSFGGISVLVRGDSVTSTRSATPRLTKAESFNSSSTSGTSNHRLSPNRANEKIDTNPAISSPSSTSPALSPSPHLATVVPTTSSATSSTESYQFTNAQTQVQPSKTVNSTVTSSHTTWASSITTSEPSPPNFLQGQQVMWAVTNVESVPSGSILINPQTGQPYLNPDGSVYRHNNPGSFASVQAVANSSGSQPVNSQTVSQQPQPLIQHLPVPSQASQQQQAQASASHQHQVQVQVQAPQQPQAQLLPSTPLLPPVVLYNQLLNQHQAHQIEQRPFTMENNSIGEISSSLNSLSFTHSLSTDAGASGDGNQVVPSGPLQFSQQNFLMSSVRPAGLVASSQGNVAQPVRVMYPVPYLSSLQQSQQSNHQLINPFASGQQSSSQTQLQQQQVHQPSGQITLHTSAENLPHPPSHTQLPGQYVQGFPMVGYSQLPNQPSGDSFSVSPYYQMTSHNLGSSSGVTSVPNFSYTAPSTLGTSVTNSSVSLNASQSPYLSSNLTIYTPLPTIPPNPNVTPGTFTHPQNSYRSQTPPTHNSGSQGLGLNQTAALQQGISLNSTYMGYSVFPSHSAPVQQQTTPTTPTQSVPGQTALFPTPFSQPVLNAGFPVFRPGISLMTVRSSTPPPPPPVPVPPHGLLQSQYNTGPLLTKSYSLPADHRFGKAATDVYLQDSSLLTGNHNQDKNLITAGLPSLPTSASVKPPHVYGRGLLLHSVGDLHLIGHPLQHQLATPIRTTLVLPQQRPLNRFPTPQTGVGTSVNRPPKVRKQRSKACSNNKADSANVTPQASVDLPDSSWGHILEIQSLPEGLKRSEAERYLEEVTAYGGKLVFSYEGSVKALDDSKGDFVLAPKYQVFAAFQSETEAQSALVNIKTTKFQLRLLSKKPPLELLRLS